MKYNKLVRDKIPEVILERGEEPIIRIANEKEYKSKLREKLQEEVEEFLADEKVEELADILEVVCAFCDLKGIDFIKLEKIRKEKLKTRG